MGSQDQGPLRPSGLPGAAASDHTSRMASASRPAHSTVAVRLRPRDARADAGANAQADRDRRMARIVRRRSACKGQTAQSRDIFPLLVFTMAAIPP
ncbi:hypothetical protein GCM10009107_35230 [Ideonella azotifigens]|uniref:Uncharacterized protein n=1 Tax=Ideonella azotifigens TaxID=513160 RepID=A0ABN1K6S7_9BURK